MLLKCPQKCGYTAQNARQVLDHLRKVHSQINSPNSVSKRGFIEHLVEKQFTELERAFVQTATLLREVSGPYGLAPPGDLEEALDNAVDWLYEARKKSLGWVHGLDHSGVEKFYQKEFFDTLVSRWENSVKDYEGITANFLQWVESIISSAQVEQQVKTKLSQKMTALVQATNDHLNDLGTLLLGNEEDKKNPDL